MISTQAPGHIMSTICSMLSVRLRACELLSSYFVCANNYMFVVYVVVIYQTRYNLPLIMYLFISSFVHQTSVVLNIQQNSIVRLNII